MIRKGKTMSIEMIRKTMLISVVCMVLFFPLTSHSEDMNDQMIKAAHRGDIATVKSLLAKGANLNATMAESGWTALMLASGEGHSEVVTFLLTKGAKVNTRDSTENTALIRAAVNGKTEIVELLLASGAAVNLKGNWGRTALMLAAQYGYSDIVRALLAHGADVNLKGELGDTALSRATDNGHTETIRILKDAGAKE
jgi:ankyrin repeat protein